MNLVRKHRAGSRIEETTGANGHALLGRILQLQLRPIKRPRVGRRARGAPATTAAVIRQAGRSKAFDRIMNDLPAEPCKGTLPPKNKLAFYTGMVQFLTEIEHA